MRSRLELKAAARKARIEGKVHKPSVAMSRDVDKPLDDVPMLKIGPLRVKSVNRQGYNQRGNVGRTPPPRTR